MAVAEVAEALDGTVAPVHPEVRGWLVEARQRVAAIKERLPDIDRDVELPAEPPEELLNVVRANVRR
jgi:hypothetical protein